MSQTMTQEEGPLSELLQRLVDGYGYPRVREALDQLAANPDSSTSGQRPGHLGRHAPSATYLMTLTPEEREPFLIAAVDAALPFYMADLAKPNAERVLTADLETGDFHEYGETAPDPKGEHS